MEVISTRIKLSADIVQLIRNYFLSRLARARDDTECAIDCGTYIDDD